MAWFSNRSLNVESITVTHLAIPSGVVVSASLIASVAMKFVPMQWSAVWMRRRGAATGKLLGRWHVACIHVKRDQNGVFREEFFGVYECHGGKFFQLERHFFEISWFLVVFRSVTKLLPQSPSLCAFLQAYILLQPSLRTLSLSDLFHDTHVYGFSSVRTLIMVP